jgi:hypothetical protein
MVDLRVEGKNTIFENLVTNRSDSSERVNTSEGSVNITKDR